MGFNVAFKGLMVYTQIMIIYSKKDMISYIGKQISISVNVTAGGAKQHWNLMISITTAKSMLR